MNTKLNIMLLSIASLVATTFAKDAYTLVNDAQGYSYIQINEDLESFKFTSDFKSIGNSGKVGFFVYPAGLEGQALKDYIANVPADNAQFAKKINHGLVDLGSLSAGDRVGFYLNRKNGDIIRNWSFENFHNINYIAFDKNGGGKDEWMSVSKVEAGKPSGQPLPGILPFLLIGGVGFGVLGMKKRNR